MNHRPDSFLAAQQLSLGDNALEHALTGFSDIARLAPHESPDKDIILLGHSMGGLLDAEVIMLPWYTAGNEQVYKHRILGTVNFDTPFLGMHPGIVGSGISSLFRRSPSPSPSSSPAAQLQNNHRSPRSSLETIESALPPPLPPRMGQAPVTLIPTESESRVPLSTTSSSLSVPLDDPNYNPPFFNDVRIPKRTGWSNALHFLEKHSSGLVHATETYVTSHFEFGGAMADFRALRDRYKRIKALERGLDGRRVRFVNYYTACTGRPKHDKDERQSRKDRDESFNDGPQSDLENLTLTNTGGRSASPRPSALTEKNHNTQEHSSSPPSSDPAHGDENNIGIHQAQAEINDQVMNGNDIVKSSANDDADNDQLLDTESTQHKQDSHPSSLLEPSDLAPQNSHAEAEQPISKDFERRSKARSKALKKLDEAISAYEKAATASSSGTPKERKKVEKLQAKVRQRRQEVQTHAILEEADSLDEQKTGEDDVDPQVDTTLMANSKEGSKEGKAEKRGSPRERRFCVLPSKIDSKPDPCWVKVFMPDVDEVGAHCGLFQVGDNPERYETFVWDVSLRIVDWLEEENARDNPE
ncbi:uncharacterized protein KY384_000992 [Bacidia gigantensis]|uniref:uncharacterized protein n=1 Tax=Bacidia gigantensis TaxID=2732470 RepID=UPI001D0361DC|nr:uncharacterized protein KY384_000992 [Bacidia gigantensis]KAG8534148.1 hypothetical protein KY384_000992 [Bacidia gigantensis]